MLKRTLAALALVTLTGITHAGEATVAVAANFAEPIKVIATDFQQATGHTLKISTGATGKFYAQIVHGAPFDVLLAADDETPARLVKEGRAVAGSALTYATGRLVLWSADAARIDPNASALKSGEFRFLAIANPKTAPYGRAALETLAALKIDVPDNKRVVGESIAQAYQFAATGNAEMGFVALSQVWKDGKLSAGSAWIVPKAMHQPIRQGAVLLNTGRENAAAKALFDYLKTPAAKRTIERYGYDR